LRPQTREAPKRVQNDFIDFNTFGSSHQGVRQLMPEDRKEQREGRGNAKCPSCEIAHRRNCEFAELQRMFAHVRRDQRDTHCENDEPAVINSNGNAVNARDENLTFEEILESHCEEQSAKG
jgi:hypothetical protein